MRRAAAAVAVTAACLLALTAPTGGQGPAGGPRRGTLVLSGAGEPHGDPEVLQRFAALAGGAGAEVVYIPSAATSIRLPSGFIADLPEDGTMTPGVEALEAALAPVLGVGRVRVLHTRDRATAGSPQFAEPLRAAHAVWIGYGNAGRLAALLLGTPVQRALEDVLARGGVVGGHSAGAIVQGAVIVRGRPDKPVLVARGHDTGFGLLRGVAVNPHLTSARREGELVEVVDRYPGLLGLGLEDAAGLEVTGDVATVLGTGRVAVYDDASHDGRWYYWLSPGARFDLVARRLLTAR